MPSPSPNAIPLYALCYSSTATHLLTRQELDSVLVSARKRNLESQVTGILLFLEGKFMQYMEGPLDSLNEIFALIKHSPLHHQIVELGIRPIPLRQYGEWSMAYMCESGQGQSASAPEQSILESRMTAEGTLAATPENIHLSGFWKNEKA